MKVQRLIMGFLLIALLGVSNETLAQEEANINVPKNQKEYEKLYQRNIKKSRINGVYIPKDLEDAFKELDALSPEEAKAKFVNAQEEVIASKLHFGLGRWMQVYWNFREGSRYVEYLRNLGLSDHDHMIQFTIVSYHRHKNNRPLEIESRVAVYREELQKRVDKLKERTQNIHSETRKLSKEEIEKKKKK